VAVTLPPAYLRARGKLAGREIELDWRKLGARKPPVWPGMLCMFDAADARRENLELVPRCGERVRDRLFFFGTNTAGLLFAIDQRGRVVVVDEIELDYPTVLARDFDTLAGGFLITEEARAKHREREDAGRGRRLAGRWKTLDHIITSRDPRLRHPSNRSHSAQVVIVDIANEYLLANRQAELLDGLRAFGRRHPGQRRLITKMRKYALAWGTGRSG
jgi:hypothetical protein